MDVIGLINLGPGDDAAMEDAITELDAAIEAVIEEDAEVIADLEIAFHL